jgi:hypothetical protein
MPKINIKAIAIGCIVDWASSLTFSVFLSLLLDMKASSAGIPNHQIQQFINGYFLTRQGMIISTIFGFGFTALGGYVAARLARTDSLLNSAFVGSISIILGLFYISSTPRIISILSLLLSIPVAIIGGFFYTKKFKLF